MYVLLNMKDFARDITVSIFLRVCIIEANRGALPPPLFLNDHMQF